MKSLSIIITAGGTGKRMGASVPKQFLELNGKPVLMHTIERIGAFAPDAQLLLTLPEAEIGNWKKLVEIHRFQSKVTVIAGGTERYHSVKNALKDCSGEVIAVHDGVRPFISREAFDRLREAAENHPAVIPVIPVKETLHQLTGDKSHHVPRDQYRIVQTPQFFHSDILKKAYDQPFSSAITDDAGLVEMLGIAPVLVEGNEENIKITVPSDLRIAEGIAGNE